LTAVPECANGPRRNCFPVTGGTEGSNPSPSSGESIANLRSGTRTIVDVNVSTKYRCHRLCHLQMSPESGGGRARSPGVAQRPIGARLSGAPQPHPLFILNSTYLYEFYKNGFNSHAQNNVIKAKYPDRFLLCGSFDPRDEETGVDAFRRMVAEYPVQGLKLYTAEWREGSRGWRLNFPDLNFIVEHVGLPRLDDFCWIAAQESNVYAGLSVAMAFVHLRPRHFAEIMANLLFARPKG
jgi:hypothetical protein